MKAEGVVEVIFTQRPAGFDAKIQIASVIFECLMPKEGVKFLILKRSREKLWEPGKWNFPGGIVEGSALGNARETPIVAAIREVHEETGFVLVGESLSSPRTFFVREEDGYEMEYYFFLVAINREFEVHLKQDDHDEARWVGCDEVSSLDFLPIEAEVIKYLCGYDESQLNELLA